MSSLALAHLTREAAAGGEDAWRALVALLDPMLHAIARGYRLSEADADDVVQITWGRALLHLGRLDDPGAVAGWLAGGRGAPPGGAPASSPPPSRPGPPAPPPRPTRRRSSASAAPSCAPPS